MSNTTHEGAGGLSLSEFKDMVDHDAETMWDERPGLRLWAYAIAKPYAPEDKDFDQWVQTANVQDFYGDVFAMNSLPPEIEQVKMRPKDEILGVWAGSAKKAWERRCVQKFMPHLREAVSKDSQEWGVEGPTWTEKDMMDYEQHLMQGLVARKAYEIIAYMADNSNTAGTMIEFSSENAQDRLRELMQADSSGETMFGRLTIEEEVEFDIFWYERPLRMSDGEWVEEKRRRIEEAKKQEQDSIDSKTEEEKGRERREQQENERETARAHAQKRSQYDVVGPRTAIDSTARGLYSDALVILSYWWDHGPQEDDEAKLAALNSRVKAAVSQDGYTPLAPTQLKQLIQDVRKCLEEVKNADGNAKEPKRLELAREVVYLANVVGAHGFDWKSITNRKTQRDVLVCLYKSEQEEVRRRRESLVRSIFEPYPEQSEFMEKFKVMLTVVASALQHRNEETLRVAIESLVHINEEDAQKINTSLGLKREDHYFPVQHLQSIVDKHFDSAATTSELHALMGKMELLGIPGTDVLGNTLHSKPSPSPDDTQRWEKELLGLVSREQETPNVQASYPLLQSLLVEPLYDCKDKKTVGWGDHNGRFYINQYGPDTAPIWRKESDPIPGYRDNGYENGLPPHQEVTNGDNRIGNTMVSGSKTKRKYMLEGHIVDVLGVAFAEDPKRDTYAYLTEKTINGTRRDSVYVLIAWDRHLTRGDPEVRWEPASELRLRQGTKRADDRIMRTAKANQKRFEEHNGICRTQPPRSPSLVSIPRPQPSSPADTRQPPSPAVTQRSRSASRARAWSGQAVSAVSPWDGAEGTSAENAELRKKLEELLRRFEGTNIGTGSR